MYIAARIFIVLRQWHCRHQDNVLCAPSILGFALFVLGFSPFEKILYFCGRWVRRFLIYALLRTIVNVVTGGRQRVSGSDG